MEWMERAAIRRVDYPEMIKVSGVFQELISLEQESYPEALEELIGGELDALLKYLSGDHLDTEGMSKSEGMRSFLGCILIAVTTEWMFSQTGGRSAKCAAFYGEGLLKFIPMHMHQPVCLKVDVRNDHNQAVLLCLALLADLLKCVLQSVILSYEKSGTRYSSTPRQLVDSLNILRSACLAFHKNTRFHKQHQYMSLPLWASFSGRHTKFSFDEMLTGIRPMHTCSRSCACSNTRRAVIAYEYHLWMVLWDHFGQETKDSLFCNSRSGFQLLKETLAHVSRELIGRIELEICDAILKVISQASEFVIEDTMQQFLEPCLDAMKSLCKRCNEGVFQKSDINSVLSILKSLRSILSCYFPPKTIETMFVKVYETLTIQFLKLVRVDSFKV